MAYVNFGPGVVQFQIGDQKSDLVEFRQVAPDMIRTWDGEYPDPIAKRLEVWVSLAAPSERMLDLLQAAFYEGKAVPLLLWLGEGQGFDFDGYIKTYAPLWDCDRGFIQCELEIVGTGRVRMIQEQEGKVIS